MFIPVYLKKIKYFLKLCSVNLHLCPLLMAKFACGCKFHPCELLKVFTKVIHQLLLKILNRHKENACFRPPFWPATAPHQYMNAIFLQSYKIVTTWLCFDKFQSFMELFPLSIIPQSFNISSFYNKF